MGLIQTAFGAAGSVLGDQWKEYFYSEALPADVIVAKGKKKISGKSSNTQGTDNIITNGSVIVVNEGQCMIIVDQGKVVEICAEAGEYTYDQSSEPTIFCGDLMDNLQETLKNIGRRITFGGDAAKDQRIYFFNTKELMGNKYGTQTPVPFRVVDNNIGLDMDISIRCFGEYSYRVTNPILFFANVCGNVTDVYRRDEIESQLKSEVMTALQPAFARVSAMGVRYSELPGQTIVIAQAMNEVLSSKWRDIRGIEIISFGVNSVKASDEDEAMIKELQRNAVFRNPNMAAAHMVSAQADAMKMAAANTSTGPAMAFMGMNMAQNVTGMNAQNLFQMGQQQAVQQPMQQEVEKPVKQEETGWTCSCGTVNIGKFCIECGSKKPEPVHGWTCSCGAVNKGKFCSECGAKKPAGIPQYKCDKCGWEPEKGTNPPKFCPECGDPFDDGDIAG